MKAARGWAELAVAALIAVASGCATSPAPAPAGKCEASEWRVDFGIEKRTLVSTGRNPYFILEPGFKLVYESRDGKLVITVLDETVGIAGVAARVVEEREWERGKLVEVSRNFFAMCRDTKDVFYFGEEVDMYEGGKVVGHDGAWRAGVGHAKPGLVMPGSPVLGMRFYQEFAPGVAMDRAEIVGLGDTFKTPAGTFGGCLRTKENSALKPGEVEFKTYAPGIGLVQDEDLLLTGYGFIKE